MPRARTTVNGELRDTGPVPDTLDALLELTRLLAAFDRRLRAGDLVITGSATHIPVHTGDGIQAEIDTLGTVSVSIT
jgi:2-keto-4-pentenoate hydratase